MWSIQELSATIYRHQQGSVQEFVEISASGLRDHLTKINDACSDRGDHEWFSKKWIRVLDSMIANGNSTQSYHRYLRIFLILAMKWNDLKSHNLGTRSNSS